MEVERLPIEILGKMMHESYRAFKKRTEEYPGLEIRLSPEQFGLLNAISCIKEDVNQNDLAKMTGKDKSAILRMIDTLEEKDLVRRVASVSDRRKKYLMVTKLGNRTIEQYIKLVKEMTLELQQDLTQEQIDTFRLVIDHLTNNAKKL
jgi:MarR family transcriptional regulator, transcriptional regulator for hemolysin